MTPGDLLRREPPQLLDNDSARLDPDPLAPEKLRAFSLIERIALPFGEPASRHHLLGERQLARISAASSSWLVVLDVSPLADLARER